MSEELQRPGSWFQRILLPGFVFKGVVIGGGYATGRELVEFFFGLADQVQCHVGDGVVDAQERLLGGAGGALTGGIAGRGVRGGMNALAPRGPDQEQKSNFSGR